MKKKLYAIGDIHGYDALLEQMHLRIMSYHEAYFPEYTAQIVHIGDYIDGGPDSKSVLDRLIKGSNKFKSVCLKGNHEDLLLRCLDTDERPVWNNWLDNGGEATLKSLGISLRFGEYSPNTLKDALGSRRIDWLQSLPLYHVEEGYLFVHAGIAPGIPLVQQNPKDLLWIRDRFLKSSESHGYCVVHGHTPSRQVEIMQNRIGIDTGIHSYGKLSAILLQQSPHIFTVKK